MKLDQSELVPVPPPDLHRLVLDEDDTTRPELVPTASAASIPPFLIVPSRSNASKFKGTPAPRTGKVLPRGVESSIFRKGPPSTPTPRRKATSQATQDLSLDTRQTSQVSQFKADARVLKRRPIPSFLPTSSEEGDYNSTIRSSNDLTTVTSQNTRDAGENRSAAVTKHGSFLNPLQSTTDQISLSSRGHYSHNSDINTVVKSPTRNSSTGLHRALSTSSYRPSSRLPVSNAKHRLSIGPVSRPRNLRNALGITKSAELSNETRPSHTPSDGVSHSQKRDLFASQVNNVRNSGPSAIISPSFSTQAVANESQYNLSMSVTNINGPHIEAESRSPRIPNANASNQPSFTPFPYSTSKPSKLAPLERDQSSAPLHPRSTSTALSDRSYAKTNLIFDLEPKDSGAFTRRSGHRHSVLGVYAYEREAYSRSLAHRQSEHKDNNHDMRGLESRDSSSHELPSGARPPRTAVGARLPTTKGTTMSALNPMIIKPLPQSRPHIARSLRFARSRSALDNRSPQLTSPFNHHQSPTDSQTVSHVPASRFDVLTYNKLHFNSARHGELSNASAIIPPEVRPADSVSQLGDLAESSREEPDHIDAPSFANNDSAETGSSFSISSSLNSTHLPDLPPLPSINSSPALTNNENDETNEQHNYPNVSRIATRVSTADEREVIQLNHDAARLRRAIEIEKSELITRGNYHDVMPSRTAPSRSSGNERITGGFDLVAQRVLNAVEYQQLVDGTVAAFVNTFSPIAPTHQL